MKDSSFSKKILSPENKSLSKPKNSNNCSKLELSGFLEKEYKFMLLGDSKVGKTSIFKKLRSNYFSDKVI